MSGDFMFFWRFVVPALPFFAVAGGEVVALVGRERGTRVAALVCGVLLLGSVPDLFGVHLTPLTWRKASQFRWRDPFMTEREIYVVGNERLEEWIDRGKALGALTSPEESGVFYAIGAVGYYSRMVVHDQCGLVDREVVDAYVFDENKLALPGHDPAVLPSFFDDREPTYERLSFYEGEVPGSPLFDAVMEYSPDVNSGRARVLTVYEADGWHADGSYLLLRSDGKGVGSLSID
ncbi:MAG: hypothetical protein R3F34_01580 [Planctomycetota bacterium]